jgi:hypothetical protein
VMVTAERPLFAKRPISRFRICVWSSSMLRTKSAYCEISVKPPAI